MGADEGSNVTCEAVAPLSTVKGSPHDVVDCCVERPRRERRVVVRREERIVIIFERVILVRYFGKDSLRLEV
jgi:hypothetical protein